MAVTLKDIAEYVGLQKSTVSRVLNGKNTRVQVAEDTRKKIFAAAKTLGYHPNAAARSLATRRTGHIGLMLSSNVTEGWANLFYSRCMASVEHACRVRGYGLNVSVYDLTNIKSFVFPERVGQRSIDGLILAGYAEAEVLRQFQEFGLPCVSLGDDLEVPLSVPTVASDFIGGLFKGVEYLVQLGHRRIGFVHSTNPRGRETAKGVAELVRDNLPLTDGGFSIVRLPGGSRGDFDDGPAILDWWLSLPLQERPTAVIATDQSLVGLLRGMKQSGLSCPQDISLLSSCDTRHCEFSLPALTAVHQDVSRIGESAVELLVKHIESDTPLTPESSIDGFPCELIIRESCADNVAIGKQHET